MSKNFLTFFLTLQGRYFNRYYAPFSGIMNFFLSLSISAILILFDGVYLQILFINFENENKFQNRLQHWLFYNQNHNFINILLKSALQIMMHFQEEYYLKKIFSCISWKILTFFSFRWTAVPHDAVDFLLCKYNVFDFTSKLHI